MYRVAKKIPSLRIFIYADDAPPPPPPRELSLFTSPNVATSMYCKRCFAGLIVRVWQHKNISQVDQFTLGKCALVIFVLHTVYNIIQWYIYKQLGSTNTKSWHHTFSSILPICINTHGQYTTPTYPKCAYKYRIYFCRFLNSRFSQKLMDGKYYYFYSNSSNMQLQVVTLW